MSRAYYHNKIASFLGESIDSINGRLSEASTEFSSQYTMQITSWRDSIRILQHNLKQVIDKIPSAENWEVLLEYEVPRLLSRIDVVLIADDLIFVIEFKLDRAKYQSADIRQVEDYALDLHHFHLESRGRTIIPVLLAPLAKDENTQHDRKNSDIKSLIRANEGNLSHLIIKDFTRCHDEGAIPIDALKWFNSIYSPTPTILQAARALFAGHRVEAITKKGAEDEDLGATTQYLVDVIAKAEKNNEKVICFVTGVPGAGKTLVGLNIIHREELTIANHHNAAYFSGNVPLVKVLREALTVDEHERMLQLYKGKKNSKPKKEAAKRKVEAKIQNLHQFIKDSLKSNQKPDERVVIFDEAQRCWDAENTYKKSQQSRSEDKISVKKSEAEFILEIMDRHDDWAVVIALIGNGQEINTGEAGIEEWCRVLGETQRKWRVEISTEFRNSNKSLVLLKNEEESNRLIIQSKLHLSVSQRSFKANKLNDWVNAVIDDDCVVAKQLSQEISKTYPIKITRDLEAAKRWLRTQQRGNTRIGLVASSGGLRLKPHGINTREEIDVPYWFLKGDEDVRSSQYLEVVATEYKIQGLEIDYACLCWDADLRRTTREKGWLHQQFSGTNWTNRNNVDERQFRLNKYRVLLTRAREGLIIWVPEGDDGDRTRKREFYDPIYDYLRRCGVEELT